MPTKTVIPDANSAVTVYGHTEEEAAPYRDASVKVMQQKESRIPRSAEPAPPTRVLPSIQVARHCLGKELTRLNALAEGLTRQAEGVIGAFNGNADPYLANLRASQEGMRQQAANQAATARAEIRKLEALDDYGIQVFAADRGVR